MKKKILTAALSAAIGMSLAACGGSADSIDIGSASPSPAASESASAQKSTGSESPQGSSESTSSSDTASDGLTKVTLQLKWVQQAQFMG